MDIDHEEVMHTIWDILEEDAEMQSSEEDIVYKKKNYFPNVDIYMQECTSWVTIMQVVARMLKILNKGNIILYAHETRATIILDNMLERYPQYKPRIFEYICKKTVAKRRKLINKFTHQKKPSLLIASDKLGKGHWKSVKMVFNDDIEQYTRDIKENNKYFLNRAYKIKANPKGIMVTFYNKLNEDRILQLSGYFYFTYIKFNPSTFEQRVIDTLVNPNDQVDYDRVDTYGQVTYAQADNGLFRREN